MDPISRFGADVSARFASGGGQPEELLRGPLEQLFSEFADLAGIGELVLAGEHQLAADRVRPDYAIYVAGALVGFVEVKAPGKGVEPKTFKGHDKEQWAKLACLPNVLYTDGQSFALFRDGERIGPTISLDGDVTTAGEAIAAPATLQSTIEDFFRWLPIPPRSPRELAITTSRLCRVLRAEVTESLAEGVLGLQDLASDWRALLYPDATDEEFADGYAQTVTFALLLARVEGIDLINHNLRDTADKLGERHTLMGRALAVLTDPVVLPKLAVSVETLRRVLGVVDWPKISKAKPTAWLYFYETFLEGYDPALRRQTGSYYTPVEVVDPMVRLVDGLLRDRLNQHKGLGSSDVTVIDPAAGTGTFLFRIIDQIADAIKEDLGPGAIGPALRAAAKRLIGFELQAGPYSVAELRLSTEFSRLDADLGADDLRLFLADTLSDPYVEESQIPATYRQIAVSRKRANEIKRTEQVLVVIGNPPFAERAKGRGGWIESGAEGAKQAAPLADFMPEKALKLGTHAKHLYNLYVYFWRWGLWKVFEGNPGTDGVVAFVTAAGFINGPGFVEMRRRLRAEADAIWVIDCSPEGHQPEVGTRIFAGVQQPICITIALRDGTTTSDTPAPAQYTKIEGSKAEKFAALAELQLSGADWVACSDDWHDSFLPKADAEWLEMPALSDLFSYSGSGTMPGRTWIIGPSREILVARWKKLISAPVDNRPELLREHKTDRTIHTQLSDNLPGYPPLGPIATETKPSADPVRYAVRSFDRAWIIPDKRLINRPNPGLWQVREAPGQIYLTAPHDTPATSGPAATATSIVPDLHHFHGRGGRAFPLWLDAAGTVSNVVPGMCAFLSERVDREITPEDFFAYVAGLLSHGGYTKRFAEQLKTPGLRVPLTAKADLFFRTAELGRKVLWLHSYGERFIDPAEGQPDSRPRMNADPRPSVIGAIPDSEGDMPGEIEFEPEEGILSIGSGRIGGVSQKMWNFEISGFPVVRRWFSQRKKDPAGQRSSPLDDLVASTWSSEWTEELIDLLHVVGMLCDIEPEQDIALSDIASGELITVQDLESAGVLPVENPPKIEQPAKQGTLV